MSDEINSIKVGKVIIELPEGFVTNDGGVKTSTVSEDGCLEILDDRHVILRYADSDYWLDTLEPSKAQEAAEYLNQNYPMMQPVARVPDGAQWAMSDEEDGSIEFYTDEELIALAADYEEHN